MEIEDILFLIQDSQEKAKELERSEKRVCENLIV